MACKASGLPPRAVRRPTCAEVVGRGVAAIRFGHSRAMHSFRPLAVTSPSAAFYGICAMVEL